MGPHDVKLFFFSLLEIFYFIFSNLSCREFTGNGLQQPRVLSIRSQAASVSGWGRLALRLNLGTFLSGFLLFLMISLRISESCIGSESAYVLNAYIYSLGKNPARNSFVCHNAKRVLATL